MLLVHNDLVDAHTDHDTELQHLKLKIADLEDRLRRNDIKFCGNLETVDQAKLTWCHTYNSLGNISSQ